jgi:hypothetical protein
LGVEHGEPATVDIRITTDAAQLLDVNVKAVPVMVPVASVTRNLYPSNAPPYVAPVIVLLPVVASVVPVAYVK